MLIARPAFGIKYWHQRGTNAMDLELAVRFLDEVYQVIGKTREAPLHYRVIELPYRRALCESFPYRIVFEIIEELQAVHIIAVMHQMRHPDQWKKRLGD